LSGKFFALGWETSDSVIKLWKVLRSKR